jgi:hypothetical protein
MTFATSAQLPFEGFRPSSRNECDLCGAMQIDLQPRPYSTPNLDYMASRLKPLQNSARERGRCFCDRSLASR